MADSKVVIKINDELHSKIAMFQKKANEHKEQQMSNPFSEFPGAGQVRRLSKADPGYGRPVEGSKTEARGLQAQRHVYKEIYLICEMISQYGRAKPDGTSVIKFGELFQLYTVISNKVVGTLLLARKKGVVDFEGEMLYQRRDDNVDIVLLYPLNQVREKSPCPT